MTRSHRIRLDEHLVENGAYASRDEVLRAVIAGEILVDDVVVNSSAQLISDESEIRIKPRKQYVSRGGLKLEGALDAFDLDVNGLRCLDIGASTGGFSDCLLQHGVSHVSCVDVNYSQLDWKIRNDPRVEVHERTNIKEAEAAQIGAPFDLIVIDVSFIGLASLASTIADLSSKDTRLLALVKPQFESKRGEAPNGVVIDERVRSRTVEEVKEALTAVGFQVNGVVESPIKGPAGNIEYLMLATFQH